MPKRKPKYKESYPDTLCPIHGDTLIESQYQPGGWFCWVCAWHNMECVIHCIDEWTIDKAKEEVERYQYPWAEPIGVVKRGKVQYRIDTMDGAWVQWKPVLSARRGLAGTVYKTPKGLHNVPSGAVAARWEDSYGRERISWFVPDYNMGGFVV